MTTSSQSTSRPAADAGRLAPALLVGAAVLLQGFSPVTLALLAWTSGALLAASGRLTLLRPDPATGLVLLALIGWLGGLALFVQGGSHVGVAAWLTAMLLPGGYYAYTGTRERAAATACLHTALIVAVFILCTHVLIDIARGISFPASLFVQKNSLAAWLALASCILAPRWLAAPRSVVGMAALAAVAMAILVIAVNGARAVAFAMLIAGLVFAMLAPLRRLRGRLLVLVLLALSAVGIAELVSGGRLAESVSAPLAAGLRSGAAESSTRSAAIEQKHLTSLTQRLAIWRSAAGMIEEMPWHGYGPGSYRLEYPRHSVPADRSTQQYAHSDPLQLLLEWGYPGALLILVLAALGLRAALRSRDLADAPRTEAAGLAAGLAAVAAHSLVSYNLFVPATLVLSGVAAARLTDLVAPARAGTGQSRLAFSRGGARAVTAAALALVTAVTGCLAAMDLYYRGGSRALAAGALDEAATGFARSYSAWPSDQALTGLAMTYLAGVDAAADEARRLALLEQANFCLDEARVRGPRNPLVLLARSEWALRLPGTGSHDPTALAHRFLEQALALNPRFHAARLARARLFEDAGNGAGAADVLEAGLRYPFPITSASLAYLDELQRLRGALGRHAGDARIIALRAELALKLRV